MRMKKLFLGLLFLVYIFICLPAFAFAEVKFVPLDGKAIAAILAKAPKPARLAPELNLELVDYIDCTAPGEAHPFADDGWSKIVDGTMGKYRETTVADNSFFSYRFNTSALEEPHLVVVEYPDDKERVVSLFLHEEGMNGTFNLNFHVEEGYSSGGEFPLTNNYCYQQLFFWPKTPWPALVCLNIQHGIPAAMSRIWVYRIKGGLPAARINEPRGAKRQIGTFYEYSHLIRYDFGNNQKGPERLAEYLAYSGQNLYSFDSVMYKWSHCFLPAFGEEKDPDTENILAACDKKQINFTAVFDPMKEFAVNGVPTGDLDEKSVLNWIKAIGEFVDKYGKHPSLKGISFGGPAGCNRMISENLGKLQQGLTAMLAKKRPDIQVYAYFGYQYLHHGAFFSQKKQGHWPYTDIISEWEKEPAAVYSELLTKNIAAYYKEMNLNIKDYQNRPGLVPVRSYYPVDQRVFETYPLGASPVHMLYRDFNLSQGCADLVSNGNAATGACLFGTYFEITPPLFEGQNFWWDRTWIAPQCNPSEPYFMEGYTGALAHEDVPFIINCGWSDPTNGSAHQVREFARAYRALPAQKFTTREKSRYITVRDLNLEGKYYFYLLNNNYSKAVLTFSLGGADKAEQLTDGQALAAKGGVFTVTLEPYQLQTFAAPGGSKLSNITITRGEELRRQLQNRINEFNVKIKRLEKSAAAPVLEKYRTVARQAAGLLAKGEEEAADLALGYALDNQLAAYIDLYLDRPRITCSRTKSNIVIDGQLDEWKGAAGVSIDGPGNLVSDHWLFNWWKGKEDLSASISFLYDNENLYIAFKVLDDKLMETDKLEFYFSKDKYLSPYESQGFGKLKPFVVKAPLTDETVTEKNYCLKRISGGYQGEMKIPLADLNIKPGGSLGMSIILTDMDLAQDYFKKLARMTFSFRKEKQMEWPVHERKFWRSARDPQACGELELKP